MDNTSFWLMAATGVGLVCLPLFLISTPGARSSEPGFRTPLGVVPLENGKPFQPPLSTGYVKQPARSAEYPYRTCYRVALSADRIEAVTNRLVSELLPDRVYAILVTSHTTADRMDGEERTFLTDFREKRELMDALEPYRFRLVHDGFVGFGFAWYDRDDPRQIEEVFVNSKKTVLVKTSQESLVEQILAEENVPHDDGLRFLSEYQTAVSDLRGFAELYPAEYSSYRGDEFLASIYVPQLVESLRFRPN